MSRALLVLLALLSMSVLPLLARAAADAPSISDIAVIESYTRLASEGRLRLGAYSRFQWHHPGPLGFYALAPSYVASGGKNAGLNAGAAAVNIVCLAYIVAVLARRRPSMAALVGGLVAVVAWRAADAMASPWNPHTAVLPLMAVVVGSADVLAGEPPSLPAVAWFASLAGQLHVALLPSVLVLALIASARAAYGCAGPVPQPWRHAVTLTALVLAGCWILPLHEQLVGTPRGNVSELWRFFIAQPREGQPLAVAVSAWSDMLVGFIRPDFIAARGAPFVESPVLWAEWLAIATVVVVALIGMASSLRRQGNEAFDRAMSLVLIASSGVALWSATRIAERIFDHDVYWMVGLGILNLAFGLSRSPVLVRSAASPPAHEGNDADVWRALAVVTVGVVAVLSAQAVTEFVDRSTRPEPRAVSARALANDIETYTRLRHIERPLLVIDEDAWELAAGAILDLQKRRRSISVEEGWVVMFTPDTRPTGRESATIRLMTRAGRETLAGQAVVPIMEREPVMAVTASPNAP